MSASFSITFQPSGRTVKAASGTTLAAAAASAGFSMNNPCGGSGTCGKCLVRIRSGNCPPHALELKRLDEIRLAEGWRLACTSRVIDTLIVEIPDASLLQTVQKILTQDAGAPVSVKPRIRKVSLTLPLPTQEDARSDLDRLVEAIGTCTPTLTALQNLPRALRRNAFSVTAVLTRDLLLDVEPGNTADTAYGLAVDIGSTTLVGTLVDLQSGRDLAVSARINPQTSFGDDVLTRIRKCREETEGLATLRTAVISALNGIIDELCEKSGVSRQTIYEASLAGNSTMQQIVCGLDPSALGELPFVPVFNSSLLWRAADMGLAIHPEGAVFVFPQIGGFVGGDTVSGIIATRLDRFKKPSLFVDIGTNGEIALAKDGKLIATSVAAGPAFEGARIINGMRATLGAIEKVTVADTIHIGTIGGGKAAGICGTGLIDAVAGLLRAGVIDFSGRIVDPDEAPENLPQAIRSRILTMLGENHFILATRDESATGEPLLLYQKDVRELQLANGAIRAGIRILCAQAGLVEQDLDAVLLAGAFGNYIRKENALRIGMLPAIPAERIHFVGNAASLGAKRSLLAWEEKDYAEAVTRKTRHVDLSMDPEFMNEFSMAMLFPEE